jgi:glutaredoxin
LEIYLKVKKRQQRAQMLLDSLRVKYETIDITEPGHEEEKELMKNVCKKRNNNTIALPPQFFNDDQYCGVIVIHF